MIILKGLPQNPQTPGKKNRSVWKRITKAPEKSPESQQYERSKAFLQQ
jgi:hypothetical protein